MNRLVRRFKAAHRNELLIKLCQSALPRLLLDPLRKNQNLRMVCDVHKELIVKRAEARFTLLKAATSDTSILPRTHAASACLRGRVVWPENNELIRSLYSAEQARAMNVSTRGFVGEELKFVDHLFAGPADTGNGAAGGIWKDVSPNDQDVAAAVGGSPNMCNGVTRGSGPTQRVGNRIVQKSLHLRGKVDWTRTLAQDTGIPQSVVAQPVRLAVILDMQANRAAADQANIFATYPTMPVGQPYIAFKWMDVAGPNLAYTKRFRCLKQILVEPPEGQFLGNHSTAVAAASMQLNWVKYFDEFIDLGDLVTTFDTASESGNIGDCIDNALHIFAIAVGDGVTTDGPLEVVHPPDVAYWSRVRFLG